MALMKNGPVSPMKCSAALRNASRKCSFPGYRCSSGVEAYRLIRAKLPTRKTFFEHVRTLMHYIDFPSWEAMMDFMMRGLEIGPYAVVDA
jgi:hypothetical protein